VANNIFLARAEPGVEATVSNNLPAGTDPRFVAGSHFELQADSPARRAGVAHAPYALGADGQPPDLGAFPYGVRPWTAGSTLWEAYQQTVLQPARPKARMMQQIGVATSPDGVKWTRLFDEPFLRNGKPGEWNSSESGHPAIFDDGDRSFLFFQGNSDQGQTWWISNVEVFWNEKGPFLPPGREDREVRLVVSRESHMKECR
jgi:hypothetical protein